MTEPKFRVGQTVVMTDVNRKKPEEVLISRVGRKLVYVEFWGREMAFTIKDGVRNDNYHHQRLHTLGEYADEQARKDVLQALKAHDVDIRWGHKISTEKLSRILDILEEDSP